MQKITTFLWFDNQAEEAMNFYTSIFKNSKIGEVRRYPAGGPMPEGTVITASFELEGKEFIGLNAGPVYKFNPAISFSIDCKDQEEVDYYWEKFSEGGTPVQCGWITDKFGLSWQVTPSILSKRMGDPDREKAARVMQAMMKMVKIDVAGIEAAYEGK